jgi:dienelactone hydrolase
MHDWETRLTTRDTNRVVRPFEWGVEHTRGWFCVNGNFPTGVEQSEKFLHDINEEIVANSDEFFSYKTPSDFRLVSEIPRRFATGNHKKNQPDSEPLPAQFLRFTSAVATPYPENNIVNARWFPAPGKRAIILLPQWNADAFAQNVLCRIFNRMGIAALRLSMPYHDNRRPPELTRADYAVSSNIGRTIEAARQAVIDIRSCLDWLETQGYSEFGIVGTSLGSCYAFLASAHDARIKVNAFNHASTYFADVVWTGQSTRHVKESLEAHIDVDRLRKAWMCISPMAYFDKYAAHQKKSLMIYARYDLTFIPELSEQVVAESKRRNLDWQVKVLPCGHYTTGETPYKYMDGWWIGKFIHGAFKK